MGCPDRVTTGDDLVFSICTHDSVTGVLTDADSNPTYRIYKEETEEIIARGEMAKLDDANTTGFYTGSITCNARNQISGGKTYTIYIEATVSSDTGSQTYSFKAEGSEAPFIRRTNFIPVGWF
jgi:N-acetylmuramic acid 6-phosphate (MurNAc-6-P) etherase